MSDCSDRGERREQLLGDLIDSGAPIAAELFSPAGLDVGAETPAEIALALIAEIQTVMAEASGEALRERKVPIHGWNIAPPLKHDGTGRVVGGAATPRRR